MSEIKKRLYTVEEAAQYLGRTTKAVYELKYDGILPHVKVGRRIHFDINDLDSFIDLHKQKNFS